MSLTYEDLQAIRDLMREEIKAETAPINNRLDSLERGQAAMQTDIRKLNQTVSKIEVEHGRKLSALYDAHVDTVRNASAIDKLDAKVEGHGVRIWALEEAIRAK